MSVVIATTRAAAQVAGGNQDITTADLDELTPGAAFFVATYATSDGVAANNAVLGLGAATSSAQWAVCARSENGVGTSDASRRWTDDECIQIQNPTDGSIDGEANFVSWITNGVRINWGNAPAAGYLITVLFFAGTDLSATVGNVTLGNQNVESDINTIGFRPDVVLLASPGVATKDANVPGGSFISFGAAVDDGSDTQRCWAGYALDGQAVSFVEAIFSENYGCGQINAGAWIWGGEVSNFDADGFSITPRLGNSNDAACYLALEFNGNIEYDLMTIDSPTAVGDHTVTGVGFLPQAAVLGLTQLTVVGVVVSTGDAGSLGVSVLDEDDQFCNSIQDEDAQGTTDTQSLSDDQVINFPDDDGTQAHVATFTGFNGDGWDWNFTATEGTAVKWWALSFGVPAGPAPVEITARNIMYIEQVTFREPYGLQLVGGDDERLDIFLTQRGLPGL